jgi:ATP-dependent protease ClpP protease subunit
MVRLNLASLASPATMFPLTAKPASTQRFGFAGKGLASDLFVLAQKETSLGGIPNLTQATGSSFVIGPNSPEDNFVIKLNEFISNDSATSVCHVLQKVEGWYHNPDGTLNKELIAKKPVVLAIRSEGGSAYDAFRIIEQIQHMQALGVKVITYADGFVASAGSLIVASGTPGFRYINKHCLFHIHESSSGIIGKFSDSIGEHEQWKRLQNDLNEMYAAFSQDKKKPEDFATEAKHDTFLKPDQVIKEWGLMDKVGHPPELYIVDGAKIEAEKAQAKAKAEAEAAAKKEAEPPKPEEKKAAEADKPANTVNPLQRAADTAKALVGA